MLEGRASLGGEPDSLLSTATEDAPSDLLSSGADIVALGETGPAGWQDTHGVGAQTPPMHKRARAKTKESPFASPHSAGTADGPSGRDLGRNSQMLR